MSRILGLALLALAVAGLCALVGRAIWISISRNDNPARMAFKWTITLVIAGLCLYGLFRGFGHNPLGAFVVPIFFVALAVLFSIIWTPHIGRLLTNPITSALTGDDKDWQPGPLYSSAIAQRKLGKPHEAIARIRQQLRTFPSDFEGQMLLAEIFVADLKDLDAGTAVIEDICRQPNHHPRNVAYALTTLADWQLKFQNDANAARETLTRIVDRFPHTEMASAAEQRLAHMPDPANLAERQEQRPLKLTAGPKNIGLIKAPIQTEPEPDPHAIAQQYVDQLQEFPHDHETREKLAMLYAEQFHRPDLAIDQFKQMIHEPGQSPQNIDRWFNRIADVHLRHSGNIDAARAALQRLIDLNPERAAAQRAQARINHLKFELRGQQSARSVTLGTYEQNLGLKKTDKP